MKKFTINAIILFSLVNLPNISKNEVAFKQKNKEYPKHDIFIHSDNNTGNMLADIVEDNAILSKYKHKIAVPKYNIINLEKNLKDTSHYFATELLFDKDTWKSMFWKDWDAVPQPLMKKSLGKQFKEYDYYLKEENWEKIKLNDWNDVPGAIKAAAFLKMINYWSEKKNLDNYVKNYYPARILSAGVALQESMLEHLANNKGDLGIFQLSPFAQSKLRSKKEFKNFKKEDFINPYTNIQAGIEWIKISMDEAKKNPEIGIPTYNKGILNAYLRTKGSLEYKTAVQTRILRYFDTYPSYSPTFSHIIDNIKQQ